VFICFRILWLYTCICLVYTPHIRCIQSLKLNVATNARSVWVKVWPRRPFSGGSISDPVQLSPTPIGDPVQLFRDPAQLYPIWIYVLAESRLTPNLLWTSRLSKVVVDYLYLSWHVTEGASGYHYVHRVRQKDSTNIVNTPRLDMYIIRRAPLRWRCGNFGTRLYL